MISVRKGVICLLSLAMSVVAGVALAQRVLAEGGGEQPLATRAGNTINVTVTLTNTATISTVPQIIDANGQTHMATWMSLVEQPLTLTVLVESVAGGGLADSAIAAMTISQLVQSLQATDYITVAITNKTITSDLTSFTWAPVGQSIESFQYLQSHISFEKLAKGASDISDGNFLTLLNLAKSMKGSGHLVLILTNGVGVEARPLQVDAMLIQLRTVEDAFSDVKVYGLLTQFDAAAHLVRIDDPSLADKLKQNSAAVRRVTGVVSYTTASAEAFTATLQIDGAHIEFSAPALPQPAPTLAATVAPSTTPEMATPAAASTATETSQPSGFTPLGMAVAGLAVVAILAAIAVLTYILLRRKRYSPYLLINERRIFLRQALTIDPQLWPGASDGASYARIAPYDKGGWVITVEPGGYMTVDGLRSRRNRLQPSAQIVFDQEGRIAMTYMERDQSQAAQSSERAGPSK
jgi:hypothetical protein